MRRERRISLFPPGCEGRSYKELPLAYLIPPKYGLKPSIPIRRSSVTSKPLVFSVSDKIIQILAKPQRMIRPCGRTICF
ncbi:unnamed protein product [Nezara viridula]|uniref:Uncharacterized protein n=1 Tax=Nezara viridula TaxID=85310 RepID=A0A9P0HHW1_NEZVI|nr:unnamed protein product [Nezara viridula]